MSDYKQFHEFSVAGSDEVIIVQNGAGDFVTEGAAGARHEILDAVAAGAGTSFTTVGDGPARRVRRTWLDTFDWRLYRAGLAHESQAGPRSGGMILSGLGGG